MKNKILTKIGALVLGLTMAVGVGVAVSSSKALETRADEVATMAGVTTASDATVNGKAAIKLGKSKSPTYGSMTITVGSGATSLKLYAAAWKGEGGESNALTLSGAAVNPTSLVMTAHNNISGSGSAFTLPDESLFEFNVTLSNITAETAITLTTVKRAVVWGATYSGGDSPDPEPVESVSLDKTELSLEVGGSEKLTATVLPANAHDKSVTWESDDETVATVADGVVTAVGVGTAIITVRTVYGDCTDICVVTVTKPEFVSSVTFTVADFSGTSVPLSATKSGVTVDVSNGTADVQIRVFKNQTITISSANNIKGLNFTCSAEGTDKYGPGCFAELEGYSFSGATGTWVGLAKSVTLTASSNQVRILELVVTLEEAADDPVLLEAAGYAKTFLETMTCKTVEDVSSVTAPEGSWGNMKTAFLDLGEQAQLLLKEHDAGDKDVVPPTGEVTMDNAEAYVEAALIRYEWIIRVYGETAYENFMERSILNTAATTKPASFDNATKNNITLVIVILSVAAITALGAYLFIDKRRNNAK